MATLHLHFTTGDLPAAEAFYSRLLGEAPSVVRDDYLKWEPSDPPVNLAVSLQPGAERGAGALSHLGVDCADPAELARFAGRLEAGADADGAPIPLQPEPGAQCCYAQSDKVWATAPDGALWELFHTTERAAPQAEQETAPSSAPAAAPDRPAETFAAPCCG